MLCWCKTFCTKLQCYVLGRGSTSYNRFHSPQNKFMTKWILKRVLHIAQIIYLLRKTGCQNDISTLKKIWNHNIHNITYGHGIDNNTCPRVPILHIIRAILLVFLREYTSAPMGSGDISCNPRVHFYHHTIEDVPKTFAAYCFYFILLTSNWAKHELVYTWIMHVEQVEHAV